MTALATVFRRHPEAAAALTEYIGERLNSHRSQLESTAVPVDKVPDLRGRIAELKALLQSLTEETPQ